MTVLPAIVLGAVQGLSEFLPISSSGHLLLVPFLLGWETQDIAFDVMVHAATLVAVVFVFWRDLLTIVRAQWRGPSFERRLGWMLVVGTIPVVVAALLFQDAIDAARAYPVAVAASLIGWGVVLAVADRVAVKRIHELKDVSWKVAIGIGAAQALSLIPGTSRSGITMTAALFAGYSRKLAARFSFLLSIPAVAGATAYVVVDAIAQDISLLRPEMIAGFLASLVAGVLAIKLMLRVIERWTFLPFALYRVALGIVILLLV